MKDFEITKDAELIEHEDHLPAVPSKAIAHRPAVDIDRELIKEIAMDIGKAVVTHIETMYPAAVEATSSTFRLSVRNTVHNEIMAALEVNDVDAIRARLAERKKHRRKIKNMARANRRFDQNPTPENAEELKDALAREFGIALD